MRAKFGIEDMGNTDDVGKVWCTPGAASARDGKLWGSAGMTGNRSSVLPKMDQVVVREGE